MPQHRLRLFRLRGYRLRLFKWRHHWLRPQRLRLPRLRSHRLMLPRLRSIDLGSLGVRELERGPTKLYALLWVVKKVNCKSLELIYPRKNFNTLIHLLVNFYSIEFKHLKPGIVKQFMGYRKKMQNNYFLYQYLPEF